MNPTIYPQSPCIQKPIVQDRPKRREVLKQLREAHLKGQFGFIQNRKQLVQYLKENPNRHNIYVLDLLQRDLQIVDEKPVQERQTVNHHVLPIFDQGSPDSWNIIQVTPQEHMQIHTLRFEVYGKEGDKKAIYATTSDFYRSTMDSENENNERPLKKEKNVVNWGVVRRTPEVTLALETGMVWTHKDGFSWKIEPESIETVKEIINRLIETLPESHPDRVRLQESASAGNYIRLHIETVFPVPGTVSRAKKKVHIILQLLRSSGNIFDNLQPLLPFHIFSGKKEKRKKQKGSETSNL